MPASSVGALNSWGAYLVASLVLLAILSPPLVSASRASREGVDLREVEGVSAVLSSLVPGMAVNLSFGSGPGGDSIVLNGSSVSSSFGPGGASVTTRLALPAMTLFPGVGYTARLVAGEVRVTGDV